MTGHGRIEPLPVGTEADYQRQIRAGREPDIRSRAAAAAARRERYRWRKARGQVDQEHLIREVVRVLAEAML